MSISKDIRLNITAEVQKFAAEMAKIPGTTQKEAAAAGRKLAAELAKAEVKAVGHSAKAAAASGGEWKAAAQSAGGVWGELAGRIENASKALGGGAGLIAVSGVALFAIDKLVASLTQVARATYDAAFAFRDAAEAQGKLLDPAVLAGLASVEDSVARITAANGELSASIVAGSAPAVSRFSSLWEDFVTGAGYAASKWLEAFTGLWGGLIGLIDRAIDSTGLWGQTLTAYADVALGGAVDAGTGWLDQMQATIESQARMRRTTEETTAAVETQTQAVERATKAGMAYNKDVILEGIWYTRTKMEMEAEYIAATEEQAARRLALEQATTEKLKLDALAAAAAQTAQLAAQQEEQATIAQQGAQVRATIADQAFATLGRIARKGGKAQALIERGSALYGIAMGTAKGIGQALGLPPPANFIAAGLVGALGAAQAGIVAGTPLPAFAGGGVVGQDAPRATARGDDERLITARPGEVVYTPDQLAAMSSGPTLVVQQVYDGRILSQYMQDDLRRGGPIGRAMRPGGLRQARDSRRGV